MIRFSLKCAEGHVFDSWFKSGDACDTLLASGHVSCAICASTEVTKGMMAPRLRTERGEAPLSAPQNEMEQAIAALRKEVETRSEDVGDAFPDEARAIYLGDSPKRVIHGKAAPEEARALREEGVPILPLPFTPKRKTN